MKPPTPPPSHFGGFVVEIPENFSWLKKVSIKKKLPTKKNHLGGLIPVLPLPPISQQHALPPPGEPDNRGTHGPARQHAHRPHWGRRPGQHLGNGEK